MSVTNYYLCFERHKTRTDESNQTFHRVHLVQLGLVKDKKDIPKFLDEKLQDLPALQDILDQKAGFFSAEDYSLDLARKVCLKNLEREHKDPSSEFVIIDLKKIIATYQIKTKMRGIK